MVVDLKLMSLVCDGLMLLIVYIYVPFSFIDICIYIYIYINEREWFSRVRIQQWADKRKLRAFLLVL